jgi:CheY-like chemotaxis protein
VAHHGAITIDTEPGKGSTFRAYLPLTAEHVPLQPDNVAEQFPELQPFGGLVMVVEDEEMLRKSAVTMLTRLGFHVLTANDGREVLEIFEQHADEIRCVLCDLTMPRMNGWETLTALRQFVPGLGVILTSGYSEAQVMEGDHPDRPQAYLSKPYGQRQLLQAIRLALASSMRGQPATIGSPCPRP